MEQRERGVAIVEAALVLPVFFLLVLGIFEFGVMFSAYHSMEGAAREGARVDVVPPSTLPAENVYVSTCTVAVPEGGTENYIQVAVHRNLQLFWGWNLPLT